MRRTLTLCLLLVAVAPVPAAGGASLDLVQPVHGPIVRHFEAPPAPYAAGHRGLDFQAPYASTVVAAAAGTVTFAGGVAGSLFVTVDLGDGFRTSYSYLSAVLVKAGARVAQGEAIARSGTGHPGADAPELHFGLREGSEYVDPEPVLLASIRRNLWRVIWLAPPPDPG